MKKTIAKLLGLAVVMGSLSACTVGYTNDPYQRAWYDVYGNYCSGGNPYAGCNFYANGAKIRASQDPYYNSGNTFYYDYWSYTDSYGYYRTYTGYAWLSSSGILYDDYGNALNEQNGDGQVSADVIAQAAAKEKQVAIKVGKLLADKYALAEDQGVAISKTLQDWAVLGRDRARTDSDVSVFATRLYGVDVSKAKNAIAQAAATQSQKPLEDLNIDVAAHWGTSPEVSKQILKNWFKEEVATYGIK